MAISCSNTTPIDFYQLVRLHSEMWACEVQHSLTPNPFQCARLVNKCRRPSLTKQVLAHSHHPSYVWSQTWVSEQRRLKVNWRVWARQTEPQRLFKASRFCNKGHDDRWAVQPKVHGCRRSLPFHELRVGLTNKSKERRQRQRHLPRAAPPRWELSSLVARIHTLQ